MTIKSKMTRKSLKIIEKITGASLTLGALLCAIRKSEDLSQVDLAGQLGITKQHLCDIEHGRKSVSPKLAANYAKKLGYSEEQFVRLALQDIVNRDGLNFEIEVMPKISGLAYA
jgi:transcriptional regulator with XRE-family HTH domain